MSNCNNVILPYEYFCTTKYDGDGSTRTFTFDWPYLGQDAWDGENSTYVTVYVGLTPNTEWTMPTSSSIRFTTAPASGACITIRRDSKIGTLIDNKVSGSRVTARTTSWDDDKEMYCLQELADQLLDFYTTFSENRLFNGYRWTGDGTTTDFPMSYVYAVDGESNESSLTNEAEVLVSIDGAHQQTRHYTLTDSGGYTYVSFGTAPADGAQLEAITMVSGIAQAIRLADGGVTGSMLADCAIDVDTWNRVICIDDLATDDKSVFIWDDSTGTGTGGMGLSVRPLIHTDISDFDAGVRENRLDQMAAPTANLSLNSKKITSLATPTDGTDAVTKTYCDANSTAPVCNSGTLSGVPGTFTIELGYDINPILINWHNVVFTGDSSQYDCTTIMFTAGTGTETRRFNTYRISDGYQRTITASCQWTGTGFIYTVATQAGGNFSGECRYTTWST